jgi:hypothetical protein
MLFTFLTKLAANPSRNYKTDELKAQASNSTLKEVVRLALDPFTQFYQRKIPSYAYKNGGAPLPLVDALKELAKLSERQVTGHAAIAFLSDLLSCVQPDDAKVIECIIQKDLKCGVQVATANAVWKDLVADYPCMLCSTFDQKLVDKIKFPAYVQQKMDGMRFNAIVRNGKVEFRSRNGKELCLGAGSQLEEAFLQMVGGSGAASAAYVFDGELLISNTSSGGEECYADRQKGNGILNKAVKGTISLEEASMVCAVLWDVVPYDAFVRGECKMPYQMRFNLLEGFLNVYGDTPSAPHKMDTPSAPHRKDTLSTIEGVLRGGRRRRCHLQLVSSQLVSTLAEAQQIFADYLSSGDEGIILKNGAGIWEDKRAKHQIKFKGELECDLKIVGIEEGVGKYVGMVGSLRCESGDGLLKVNVGSGLNDSQRKEFIKGGGGGGDDGDVVGKIVAIKYNSRIKNKASKEESLFLPIFVEIRHDKDVADNLKDIA